MFYIVVCKDGGAVNTYSIRVDDITTLINSINAVWDDSKYAQYTDTNSDRIDAIHSKQGLTYLKCSGNYEKSFLQQFNAFGISLYKAADDTMTHWSKLELDPIPTNPIKTIPCI